MSTDERFKEWFDREYPLLPESNKSTRFAIREASRMAWNARQMEVDLALARRNWMRHEIERLNSWHGLMSILDEHYPPEVFDGSSGDPGARIVVLLRVVDELRKFVRRYGGPHLRECNLNMLREPLTCTCRRDEQACALGIVEDADRG